LDATTGRFLDRFGFLSPVAPDPLEYRNAGTIARKT
jgi:hypothetical protein